MTLLRRVCDGESIEAQNAALALIARSAHGSFRDAVSTLDQLASATTGEITAQEVLQLVGAVEEESLFRLCDAIVDRDTAGVLVQIEELAAQGQDLGRLVTDLLDHLRHLLLVQNIGTVPDSLPVTEETRDRLREQANQLPEPSVLRLIDLLAVAVEDMRQGGDPRLPLELALVKVTRPQADLQRESLAHRVELLEARRQRRARARAARAARPRARPSCAAPQPTPSPPAPDEETGARRTAVPKARRSSSPSSRRRGSEASSPPRRRRRSGSARYSARRGPSALDGNVLTLEFPRTAEFHREKLEEPRNLDLVRDALHEVTGRRLSIATTVAERAHGQPTRRSRSTRVTSSRCSRIKFEATEVEEIVVAKFDMNAMLKQAQQMQEQMAKAAGGGAARGRRGDRRRRHGRREGQRCAASSSRSASIPRAIDPDDPELLADIVLAAANEALRNAHAAVEAKLRAQMPDLGALGLPGF